MIPTFRKAILQVEDKNAKTLAKEENLLYQLKVLCKVFRSLALMILSS